MKDKIIKKIDEAINRKNTSNENKLLLIEARKKLIKAKTENRIIKIVAVIIKVITGLFDND